MKEVPIRTETINLDQFLKWSGVVLTGGQAKLMIKEGLVKVNGQVETKRSRKLYPGDVVEFQGQTFLVKGGSE